MLFFVELILAAYLTAVRRDAVPSVTLVCCLLASFLVGACFPGLFEWGMQSFSNALVIESVLVFSPLLVMHNHIPPKRRAADQA